MHVIGTISARGDISGTPTWIGCAVIFVPGNGVVVKRGRDNIQVSIAVHVDNVHIDRTVSVGGNVGGGPARIGRAVVLVPGNSVVIT